jgi:Holliday junction resolvasome RuvABC endonuclease subunit
VPVGTIKKHATGKGNAEQRLAMIEAMAAAWPYQVTDDNVADALALLHWALEANT